MSEQQCIRCTWDGVTLVKMCKHHAEIDWLQQRLAAAEALVKEAREHDPDVYWLSRDWHARAANGGRDE